MIPTTPTLGYPRTESTTPARSRRIGRGTAASLGVALTVAGLVALGAAPAHADTVGGGSSSYTYGVNTNIGATVGGGTPGYYMPAGSYSQTTCVANTQRVSTLVSVSPRSGTAGQYFNAHIWARDVTGGIGAWSDYGYVQQYVATRYANGSSVPSAMAFATSSFTGYHGHRYQVMTQVQVYTGTAWQVLSTSYSNHYSTFGAAATNTYGQLIQSTPGASASSCQVY